MSLLNTLAERLKRVRIDSKLKQSDFAAKLGVKQSYLSAMERGVRPVPTKIATAIIEQFGVSQEWLFSADRDINGSGVVPLNGPLDGPPKQKVGNKGTTAKKPAGDSTKGTTQRIPAAVLASHFDMKAYKKRAEQWTDKQAEYKELFKSDLRRNDPDALQLITESDHLLWLSSNINRFALQYFKAFTWSRFGFDVAANFDVDPEAITYEEYRQEVMQEVVKMEKYRQAITTANAKMREVLRELLPLDEAGVIQRFLLDE